MALSDDQIENIVEKFIQFDENKRIGIRYRDFAREIERQAVEAERERCKAILRDVYKTREIVVSKEPSDSALAIELKQEMHHILCYLNTLYSVGLEDSTEGAKP